jgi:hypothetical protein
MTQTVSEYKKSLANMKADFQLCRTQHDRAQVGVIIIGVVSVYMVYKCVYYYDTCRTQHDRAQVCPMCYVPMYLCTFVSMCLCAYVLCTMYYVLCTMYYVLCTMYYVLCTMYYVLCPMSYVLLNPLLCYMLYVITTYYTY